MIHARMAGSYSVDHSAMSERAEIPRCVRISAMAPAMALLRCVAVCALVMRRVVVALATAQFLLAGSRRLKSTGGAAEAWLDDSEGGASADTCSAAVTTSSTNAVSAGGLGTNTDQSCAVA